MDSITVSGKKGMNISKAYSEELFFFRTNKVIQDLTSTHACINRYLGWPKNSFGFFPVTS